MEFSNLQTIALVVLTTILTDKYLIDHTYVVPPVETTTQNIITPTPVVSILPSPQLTPIATNPKDEIILKEIQNLRKEIAVKSTPIPTNTIISTLSPNLPPIGGMVKINSSQWTRLDVYEKPMSSSKVINSIVYGSIYFYTTKSNGWYQLNLDGGQTGWVQAQFLQEYP